MEDEPKKTISSGGKKIILELDYPCRWIYKIIGEDEKKMRQAVAGTLSELTYNVSYSRSSKQGKYHCLNVEVFVESNEQRIGLHQRLQKLEEIKIIL